MSLLNGIKTINGIPLDVCLNILQTDDWFDGASDSNKKRRVKWSVNGDNINFVSVARYDKDNKPANNNSVGKSITFTNILTKPEQRKDIKKNDITTDGLLAALVFTVNGNGGPYKTFTQNISHISAFIRKYNNDSARAYVNHICWVVNNSWALSWDEIVKLVGIQLYNVPKSQKYDIFSYLLGKKDLFTRYTAVFNANTGNKNLQMDLSRFRLYSSFKPLLNLPKQANTRTGTRRTTRRTSTRRTQKK